jgi:hypothetical protein
MRPADTSQLPANIRQDIIERTDGIPLFVEARPRMARRAEPSGGSFSFADLRFETDCMAGHIGFEPANPSASYLIGIS